MAISAYVGVMGSGKSFEVVSTVIVEGVRQGRRVLTNIDGVNAALIYDYVEEKWPDCTLGEIVMFTTEQAKAPGFFPHDEKEKTAFVQGGDLICIDECWRFWGEGDTISEDHMTFFRMHRHMVRDDGLACDLVVLVQDLTSLHRKIRTVVEVVYRMHKLKAIGMPSRYRVEVYDGHRMRVRDKTATYQRSYDKRFFAFYHSFKGGKGKEAVTDKRQNVFMRPGLWFTIVGVSIACVFAFREAWKFFHPAPPAAAAAKNGAAPGAKPPARGGTAAPGAPAAAPRPSNPTDVQSPRIVGLAKLNSMPVVVVLRAGRLSYFHLSQLQGLPPAQFLEVDGERITR